MVGETLDAGAAAAEQSIVIALDVGQCAFRHGFPSVATIAEPLPPGAYILDIDSYDDAPQTIDVAAQLEVLLSWNRRAFSLLRASVKDDLWAAFLPEVSR
jgi:hypothetical protein